MTNEQFEKMSHTMQQLMNSFIDVGESIRKFAESTYLKFGYEGYQRAGYRYGKSVRGYKKWRKQQFGW